MAANENPTGHTDQGLATVCDGNLGVYEFICSSSNNTIDRNDPFVAEGNGTAKFIGGNSCGTISATGNILNSDHSAKFDYNLGKLSTNANASSKHIVRTELPKTELLNMLCYLEGELQARDVVIAALRNERVKQLIQTLRNSKNVISTTNLDDPQAALFRDNIALSGNHVSRQSSTQAVQADIEVRAIIEQQMESLYQVVTKQRQTQIRMIKVLSESLENNQRMRLELDEEKRKHEHDTAQGDDITYGLEIERTKLKQDLEQERNAKKKLEKDMKKLQEQLDFERGRQKQIVLLLLAERRKIIMKYIEERKRSEDLAQILSEEKQRSDSIAEGLEEESKKSLRMEAELEKQTLTIETERKNMKLNLAKEEKRIKELELELAQLRSENEAHRKQTVPLRNLTASHSVPVPIVPAKVRSVAATGIARSISPGQSLRQQATIPVGSGDNSINILGGTGQGSTAGFNTPPTKVHTVASSAAGITGAGNNSGGGSGTLGNATQSQILSTTSQYGGIGSQASTIVRQTVAGLAASTIGSGSIIASSTSSPTIAAPSATVLQNNNCINNSSHSSSSNIINSSTVITNSISNVCSSSGGGGGGVISGSSGGNTNNINNSSISNSNTSNCSNILTGINATSTVSGIGTGSGRGVPPPIPPNKPIVPPKREPSVSRITTIPNAPTSTSSQPSTTSQSSSSSSASANNCKYHPSSSAPSLF